jgi:eukaryotic-like serine/threonine-protein kinase
LALALAGDSDGAERIAQAVSRQCPEDTITQRHALPSIRAVIAMSRNRPAEAIKELEKIPPYEKAVWFYLLPVYLRGVAYLKLGNPAGAAAEFQQVLDNPGLTQQSQTSVLSHLQLGRAQEMMGNKDAARKSYQEFLTLWKDADPDIPIYQQAKAEYASLR